MPFNKNEVIWMYEDWTINYVPVSKSGPFYVFRDEVYKNKQGPQPQPLIDWVMAQK